MQENNNVQTMTPEQGVIEILSGRIGELERDIAQLRIALMLKEQENSQPQGEDTSVSSE